VTAATAALARRGLMEWSHALVRPGVHGLAPGRDAGFMR
jgi:hypothetical protein